CHLRRNNKGAPKVGHPDFLSCQEASARFFQQAEGEILALDHVAGDFQVADSLVVGQVEHEVEHQLFEDHAQAARSNLAAQGLAGDGGGGFHGEVQADVFKFKEALVLLED